MFNHSDQTFWTATAIAIVLVSSLAGYGLARVNLLNDGPHQCEVQIIDGAGIRHLWQTSCRLTD